MKERFQNNIIRALFLFSGLISLTLQVVWLKKFVLVFGNTIWAVSTLLTTFMAGLALGSWLFGRIADRLKHPLLCYGVLEGAIGLYGLATPFLFVWLTRAYIPLYALSGGDNWVMGFCKFGLGFLALFPPTICMGGTLPLLAAHFTRSAENAEKEIGGLYAINTLGAVLGTCLTGFFLIPYWGIAATLWLAVAAGIGIFLICAAVTRRRSQPKTRFVDSVTKGASRRSSAAWILSIYLICGFAALAYEMLWNRILVLHLGSSVYAYSVMLAIYLLGVTLGAALMSALLPNIERPLMIFALLQGGIALDVILTILQFSTLAENLGSLYKIVPEGSQAAYLIFLMLGVAHILLLPTLLFGASFPVAVRLFVTRETSVGKDTGTLYMFNTIGNILGSFLTGFVLLPFLGAQRSLLLAGSINLFVAIFVLSKSEVSLAKKWGISAVLIPAFYGGYLALTSPNQVILTAGVFLDQRQNTVKLLSLHEDVYATVTVEEHNEVRGAWRQLSLNGTNVAGTSSELFSIQKLQGHLPLLLHKNPKSVLHIGFGSGGTAWAVSRYPVERMTIAEISKSVIQKASEYFLDINHGVLNDPRVKVAFTDGRNHALATRETYDVILSDSIHPRFSGNGSLYTHEYYHLLKQRLNPGGVVSQWLPFYSLTPENFKMIIKSFYEVFPNTTVWYPNSTMNEYVIVIGKLDDSRIDYPTIEAGLRRPEAQADLREIETATPYKILDYFLFANEQVGEFVKDVPLHTDDNMAVEYISGRNLDRAENSYQCLKELISARTSVVPFLDNLEKAVTPREEIETNLRKYEAATTYNLRGQLFFWENNRAEAFRSFEFVRQLNPDDLEPVEYFGSSYQKPFLRQAEK